MKNDNFVNKNENYCVAVAQATCLHLIVSVMHILCSAIVCKQMAEN